MTVVHVPAVDTRRPYSNRLVQLTSGALEGRDHVVLYDCDLAFCDDISAWVTGDAVRAKLVDLANPSLAYERRLFREAGFAHAPAGAHPTHEETWTYANNLNGGLYIQRSWPARGHAGAPGRSSARACSGATPCMSFRSPSVSQWRNWVCASGPADLAQLPDPPSLPEPVRVRRRDSSCITTTQSTRTVASARSG